jgi:alkanesulfonate monooxygenase SsuD/methylene tetrahydromethanopterin reductase-like flavin-dependent oxidoreductase (luciferase family)
MYESDFQTAVSSAIIEGEVDRVTLGVTDNERCVIVTLDDRDAAYTADEARELAQSIKCVSDQRWEGDNDDVVEYIRDLAAVVDGDKVAEEVEEEWEGRGLDTTL